MAQIRGAYSVPSPFPANLSAAKFPSQGNVYVATDAQIKSPCYPLRVNIYIEPNY